MLTDAEAKEQIIQITNELFSMGLLTATGGNISALASDGQTLWITPSQMYKGGLRAEDLVHIHPDGAVIEGTRMPSVEYQMHARAYQVRPGMTGAIHTHAPVATAFGICNQSFPPINTDAVFLRDTVTVPWFMPGSLELAEAVADALKKSRGAILQNHGLMTVGDARHDARGDGEDRALREAVRRHRQRASRRLGGAARGARGFRLISKNLSLALSSVRRGNGSGPPPSKEGPGEVSKEARSSPGSLTAPAHWS
jgi:ribulose-5-phosphate 4-epimerase/fuculose-1-phosphate aldolase